jgi:hypothetical protein
MPLPEFREPDERIGELGTVGDFWRWAMSDLLGNRARSILAEYIVAKLLGADLSYPRLEWDAYDLLYAGHRIEVKSSAYIQTWHEPNSKRSTLRFSVGQHLGWDARQNIIATEKKHSADIYVFCIFPRNPTADNYDVLNIEDWEFYLTSTLNLQSHLTVTSKTIGLAKVKTICGPAVGHQELKAKVDAVASGIDLA